MKQSRAMSLVEAIANVAVGHGVAVVTQILIYPVFGLHTTLAQKLKVGAVFTTVSIGRGLALRRLCGRSPDDEISRDPSRHIAHSVGSVLAIAFQNTMACCRAEEVA